MTNKRMVNPVILSLFTLALLLGVGFFVWQVLLNPNAGEEGVQSQKPTMAVKLFFAEDVTGSEYATKDIRLVKDQPLQETVPALIEKMDRVAVSKSKWSWWPETLMVRSVYKQKNGGVILDFEKQVQYNHRIGAFEEFLLIKSVVKTLMEYDPDVKSVRILAGGQEADTLIGHVDITRSFSREDL